MDLLSPLSFRWLLRPTRDYGSFDDLEGNSAFLNVDNHLVPGIEYASQNHPREFVIHAALDGAPQRTRPELRVEALLGQQFNRFVGELDLYVLGVQAALGALQQ